MGGTVQRLNRPPPTSLPNIPPTDDLLDIDTGTPTKGVIKVIKTLKSGKAAGPDGIPPEALKAKTATSAEMLLPLLKRSGRGKKYPKSGRRDMWSNY